MDPLERRLRQGNPMPFNDLPRPTCEAKLDDQAKGRVKVRYLVQGILTIPEDQIPVTWANMTPREKWKWMIEVWWEQLNGGDLLHGLNESEGLEECYPGLLEELEANGDYETIAKTRDYASWWSMECATQLVEQGDF
jgi:hypothetical protein